MRTLLWAVVAALLALPIDAATRLTYAMSDKAVQVEWPAGSFPIHYQIERRVASTLSPALIDRAFGVWSALPDAAIRFQSDGVIDGAKAGFDGKNTVALMDDLLRDQRALALTTNWYDNTGRLTEADIQIDAGLAASGQYNMQQTVAHEVGHVLGLDHSPVLSSVMFPYVARGNDAPRLDSDDRIAIGAIYPRQSEEMIGGILKGRVVGSSGGIFAAQVVAVNVRGEPVATGLTNNVGEFELKGVPPGEYRLYAEPLDGPVDTRNLTGVWREAKVTPFSTEFCGTRANLRNGEVIGNLMLDTAGPPVTLNPKWFGLAAPNADTFSLGSTSAAVRLGDTVALAIAGDGILAGTTFEVLNPGIRRVSEFRYAANYVYANFTVAPDSTPGSAVILVRSGNQTAALTGALRVQEGAGRIRIVRR